MSVVEWGPEAAQPARVTALAEIQKNTPAGYGWKLEIGNAFGFYTYELTLVKIGKFGIRWSRWSKRYRIGKDGDGNMEPDKFRDDVLDTALEILAERSTRLNTPDWVALAKTLQDALNGKTD